MAQFFLTCLLVFASAHAMAQTSMQAEEVTTQFNRAVVLQQQNKFDEAAAEYRALLQRKPDYVEAQANLGVVLARLGKFDEAIRAYETAYKLAPQLTPILLNLGIAYYRAGQFAKAVEVFPQFLAKQPNAIQARQLYGLSLATLGQDEEAIRQLEPTLDEAPPDPAVLYTIGLSYLRAGKQGFRATLERLAAFPAGRPALHLLQGQAFLRDQEFEQALEELQAAEKLNPALPRLYYTLGLAHQQLAHTQEAIRAFETELQRVPQDAATLYALASVLEADGNTAAAESHVRAALKLTPNAAEANALLGKILVKQNKPAEAVQPLESAVQQDASDPEKRYLLARVYQQLGRREEAAREFAEVQKLKAARLKKDREKTPKP
jgi:tetratricopeptide (TPR) repeat protein